LIDGTVEEHNAFHDGLDALGRYAETTKTNPDAYKADELLNLVGNFVGPFREHLGSEIERILAMQDTDDAVARRIMDEGKKRAMDGADRATLVPFILGCHDRGFEGGKHYFPPMPQLVRMVSASLGPTGRGGSALWWSLLTCSDLGHSLVVWGQVQGDVEVLSV
jgi:hypothetical protein